MPMALFSLFLAVFCIGTTEFMIAGLLPEIASDLGVSIPTAGYLVTAYALGVALGGPIVTMLTSRFPRKPMILLLMGAFVAGHVLGASATSFEMLMCARIAISFTHGTFVGLAAIIAVSLVSDEKHGSAIAVVLAGFTVANVLGAPGGTAIGNAWDWRATFWLVGGLGILSAIFMAICLPNEAGRAQTRSSLKDKVRVLGRQQVLTSFLIVVLKMIAVFSLFTYIAPFLIEVTGFALNLVPWLLLGFGMGSTIGVFLGGRLADLAPARTLITGFPLLFVIYGALFLLSGSQPAMAILVFAFGATNFALAAALQSRILKAAAAAPDLASTMISSVFNLGIAAGSAVGAVALSNGFSYAQLPLIGATLMMVTSGLAVFATRLDRPAQLPLPAVQNLR